MPQTPPSVPFIPCAYLRTRLTALQGTTPVRRFQHKLPILQPPRMPNRFDPPPRALPCSPTRHPSLVTRLSSSSLTPPNHTTAINAQPPPPTANDRGVLPERQKLILGLKGATARGVTDDTPLGAMGLKPNRAHKVRMMGQVEAAIAAEERKSHDTGGRPPVINDLDEDVRDRMAAEAAAAEEEAEALEEALADESATIARRLERYTRKTEVCVINAPRAGTQKRRWRRERKKERGREGGRARIYVVVWVGVGGRV